MIVYQLALNGQKGYIISADSMGFQTFLAELENLGVGDRLSVIATEMSQEKFESLPEFEGW